MLKIDSIGESDEKYDSMDESDEDSENDFIWMILITEIIEW